MREFTRFFLIVIILQWSGHQSAQPLGPNAKYIDSILPLLKNMPEDAVKVNQLERLSVMYIEINPDSAILFGKLGDSIAEKSHYYEGQIRCLTNITFAHIMHSNWAVAERKRSQPEGYNPEITVSTRKKGDRVEICISDNGIGIPEKLLNKIFQPFFTTKPSGQGAGLGLSLSYDILKAHGGELIVNTKEGEGTVFTIQLPV